jgi:hypothetical protein
MLTGVNPYRQSGGTARLSAILHQQAGIWLVRWRFLINRIVTPTVSRQMGKKQDDSCAS